MEVVDQSILAALKASVKAITTPSGREKADRLLEAALRHLKQPELHLAMRELYEYFLHRVRSHELGRPQLAPTKAVLLLAEKRYVQSSEYAWLQLGVDMDILSLEEKLSQAPSEKVLQLVAKADKTAVSTAITILKANPELADTSPILDWIITKSNSDTLEPIYSLLLSASRRAPHLASRERLLATLLGTDKDGRILTGLIKQSNNDPSKLSRLHAAITSCGKTLGAVLTAFPKLLGPKTAKDAIDLLPGMLSAYPGMPTNEREQAFAGLCVLVGQLLSTPRPTEYQRQVLNIVNQCAEQWQQAFLTNVDAKDIWLLGRSSALSPKRAPDSHITLAGARLVVDALEKAQSGVSGKALLEALALNLGLDPLANAGEKAQFSVDIHEDSVGGLIKGDTVIVLEPGWQLGDKVVRRVKVTLDTSSDNE